MKYYTLFIFLLFSFIHSEEYFQQDVTYDIEVTLNDEDKTLSAFEKLTYKNNSKDTLNFIWFHLWPNAYKSDSSAMAKQFIRLGSTRFLYAKEKNRGYIDSLDFYVDGVKANWNFLVLLKNKEESYDRYIIIIVFVYFYIIQSC